ILLKREMQHFYLDVAATGVNGLCSTTGSTAYTDAFSLPAGFPVLLRTAVTRSPGVPDPNSPVSYAIRVTNAGLSTVDTLTVTADLPAIITPVAPGVTLFAPAGFTSGEAVVAGGARRYTWTNLGLTLTPGGSVAFTITGTMTMEPSCASVPVSLRTSAVGSNAYLCSQTTTYSDSFTAPAALAAAMSLRAVREVEGRYHITLILTVSDTGKTEPNGITASEFIPSALPMVSPAGPEVVLLSGPLPSSWPDPLIPVPCGNTPNTCSSSFTWTYRSTSIKDVTWTAQVEALTYTRTTVASVRCTVSASATTKFVDVGEEGSYTLDRNLLRSGFQIDPVTNNVISDKVNISFNVRESGRVRLEVYNGIGQKVRTLFDEYAIRRQPYNPDPADCWNTVRKMAFKR
ncbi:MAG: hypothetical protein AAB368_00945, partial [bacterium]